ncbi:MAG TPA: MFS transporter, partial [Actinomycetes bacterium]
MSPTFHSLRIRNYRLYAAGGVVSNVGTWMQRVAQDWLVLQLSHNDGVALGITTGLQFLPMLLFGPLGGMLADRYSKRRLLVVTQAFMGAVGAVLGVLDITGVVQVWHVFVLA